MVPCSGTNISSFEWDLDSFNRRTITIIVTKDKFNAAKMLLLITDVAEKHLIIATKFTNFQLGQHCVIEPR
jgi:hypothetical protein